MDDTPDPTPAPRAAGDGADHRRWTAFGTRLGHALLTDPGPTPEHLVAEHLLGAAAADLVLIVTPYDSSRLVVKAAAGGRAAAFFGMLGERVGSLTEQTLAEGVTASSHLLVDDWSAREPTPVRALSAPIPAPGGSRGVAHVFRHEPAAPFHAGDRADLLAFCQLTAAALEAVENRAAAADLVQAEERLRRVRELHEDAVQRLFAVGVQLQVTAAGADPALAARIDDHLDALETVSADLRAALEGDGPHRPAPVSPARRLQDLAETVTSDLGIAATTRYRGPDGSEVDEDLLVELVGFARRVVHDLVRPSDARRVELAVDVGTDHATVEVNHDGPSLHGVGVHSGEARLTGIADRLHGRCRIERDPDGDTTTVTLTVPVARRGDDGPVAALRPPAGAADAAASADPVGPDPELDRLAGLVREALGVPTALITVVGSDRQWFAGRDGLGGPHATAAHVPLSHSFCRHVVDRDEPMVVTDARDDPRLRESPAIAELGVVAYAGHPLRTPDGTTIGAVCAIDQSPHPWRGWELRTLADVARLATRHVAGLDDVAGPPTGPPP